MSLSNKYESKCIQEESMNLFFMPILKRVEEKIGNRLISFFQF